MKIKPVVFYVVFFLIPINTYAVYDILSINITPTDNEVQFCFRSDYIINAHTYLAAQMNNQFYFLSPNKEMNQWLPGNEPPFFLIGRHSLKFVSSHFQNLSCKAFQFMPAWVLL